MSPQRLAARVLAWQLLFTLAAAAVIYNVPPFLLLLSGPPGRQAGVALSASVLLAGSLSSVQAFFLVRARRRLLRQLQPDARNIDQIELPKLNDDPWLIVNVWVVGITFAVIVAMTVLRPAHVPPSLALTLGLFASIIVAALSLPLLVLIRADFVRVMQRVSPEIMAEIIDAQVRSGRLRGRTSRRLIAAIVTPVAFLALGSSLIASAHLRADDESALRQTALSAVRLTLDGAARGQTATRVEHALRRHGYRASLLGYEVERVSASSHRGATSLLVPVSGGAAAVELSPTTAWPIDLLMIPLLVLAVAVALLVGLSMGSLLSRDLRMANRGVMTLGTDAALDGTRVMQPARFRAVVELGEAIELLASRFRLFAQTQERSISARESATKARGRFFASVSHDLKSPLNAILGFAELSRQEEGLNAHQHESLDLIVHRGRELLGLIETILDAARVEAGQLRLELNSERIESLVQEAIDKGRELVGDRDTLILFDAPHRAPEVVVDRLRLSQALATLIGHALRTAERSSLRILVDVERRDGEASLKRRRITIHIEVPSARFSAQELEAMLSPESHPGQHRGVSLALRLAKSIIELHAGRVKVVGRTVSEPAFAVELRGRPGQ